MDDERKGNAGRNGTAVKAKTEEGRQPAKHLKTLNSLALENAIQIV